MVGYGGRTDLCTTNTGHVRRSATTQGDYGFIYTQKVGGEGYRIVVTPPRQSSIIARPYSGSCDDRRSPRVSPYLHNLNAGNAQQTCRFEKYRDLYRRDFSRRSILMILKDFLIAQTEKFPHPGSHRSSPKPRTRGFGNSGSKISTPRTLRRE